MALPVTIGDSDTSLPDKNYYCGPRKSSGGNFYLLTSQFITATNNVLRIFKATDPTSSFTAQDTGNAPEVDASSSDDPAETAWLFQKSDVLHISFWDANGAAYRYITFNMADDTWGSELTIEAPADAPEGKSCSIAVDSESADVMVLYNGDFDKVMGVNRDRVDMAVKVNGSFTQVGTLVGPSSASAEEDWFGSVIVRGSVSGGRSRFHFCFKNDTLNDGFQRTVVFGGSTYDLETFPSAGDTATSGEGHVFGPGMSYDDGGTQRIRCPYRDNTFKVSYAEFDSVDAPGAFTPNVDVSDNNVEATSGFPIACTAVDGTDEHLLYSDSVDSDLFHDKNDGTDVEILDGVTVNRISCNVYDRSGTKLAYVYDDGGTIKYNEVDIAVAAVRVASSMMLLGVGQ